MNVWRCLALAVLWVSAVPASALERNPTQSDQGVRLHATGDYEHVNLELQATLFRGREGKRYDGCAVTLDRGALRASCSQGESPVGLSFRGPYEGRTVWFTIVGQAAGATPEEYSVITTADPPTFPNPRGRSLCDGQRAIAVPYAWSTSGELLDDEPGADRSFTFACPNGVISKCVRWGYPPWGTGAEYQNQLTKQKLVYDDRTARQYHQTCVRMASADYCGEGNSNTVDGTPVGFADVTDLGALATIQGQTLRLDPQPAPGTFKTLADRASGFSNDDRPELEAVWGLDGCGRTRVLCLGKSRWDTLSLAGMCVDGVMARRLVAPPPSYAATCARPPPPPPPPAPTPSPAPAPRPPTPVEVFRCRPGKATFERESACARRCGRGCLRERYQLDAELMGVPILEANPGGGEKPLSTLKLFHCRGGGALFESGTECGRGCRPGCIEETIAFDPGDTALPLHAGIPGMTPGGCGPQPPPQLCEQWTLDALAAGGATLFSYSSRWTKVLVSFFTADGGAITTTEVEHALPLPADGSDAFTLKLPNAKAITGTLPEGRLFKATLPKSLQDSIGGLIPLYRCKAANGGHVTTTVPCGDQLEAVEGLIYSPDHPPGVESRALYLYATGSGFVTTTANLSISDRRLIGYLPIRSQLAYRHEEPY